jgi:hypothetical protein
MNAQSVNGAYGNKTINAAEVIVPARSSRKRCRVYNNDGTNGLLVGFDASLTTSNGIPIPKGTYQDFTFCGPIYGIPAAGTCDVRWIDEGF